MPTVIKHRLIKECGNLTQNIFFLINAKALRTRRKITYLNTLHVN